MDIFYARQKEQKLLIILRISAQTYTLWRSFAIIFITIFILLTVPLSMKRVCSWIQEELALPGLAAKIRPALGKFASVEDILYPVFKGDQLRTLRRTESSQ